MAASAHAQSRLSVNAGIFDTGKAFGYHDGTEDDTAALFGAEYQGNPFYRQLAPMIGAFVTTDGGAYGYGGFLWPFEVAPRWYLIPEVAVGAYAHGGGKDLGGVLEFRSGLEVAYELDNKARVGLGFHHLSNASIYEDNPGVETLTVHYSFPW